MKNTKKLNLYSIGIEGMEYMVSVVAETPSKAKSLAIKEIDFEDCDYTELRCKKANNSHLVDFKKVDYGYLNDNPKQIEYLLKVGVFGTLVNWNCPNCNKSDEYVSYDTNRDKFYCGGCEEQ